MDCEWRGGAGATQSVDAAGDLETPSILVRDRSMDEIVGKRSRFQKIDCLFQMLGQRQQQGRMHEHKTGQEGQSSNNNSDNYSPNNDRMGQYQAEAGQDKTAGQ